MTTSTWNCLTSGTRTSNLIFCVVDPPINIKTESIEWHIEDQASCGRIIQLLAHPLPSPSPVSNCLSFCPLCVAGRANWRESVGERAGEEPNHTTARKPGPTGRQPPRELTLIAVSLACLVAQWYSYGGSWKWVILLILVRLSSCCLPFVSLFLHMCTKNCIHLIVKSSDITTL